MSPFVVAAHLVAYRFEVQDFKYALSKAVGFSPEELKKLDEAINAIGYAEQQLKSFRFIKKMEDLPKTFDKPVKTAKK